MTDYERRFLANLKTDKYLSSHERWLLGLVERMDKELSEMDAVDKTHWSRMNEASARIHTLESIITEISDQIDRWEPRAWDPTKTHVLTVCFPDDIQSRHIGCDP